MLDSFFSFDMSLYLLFLHSITVALSIFIFTVLRKINLLRVENSALMERVKRICELEAELKEQSKEVQALREKNIELSIKLSKEQEMVGEKVKLLQEAENSFKDAFYSLSSKALNQNNQSFLELAKQTMEKFQVSAVENLNSKQKEFSNIVAPIKEALSSVDKKISEIEKSRIASYESIAQQVKNLIASQNDLRAETANLSKALRSPTVRGRWGEMQLRRVVEMSGLSPHCDFIEQANIDSDASGGALRPDMIINLPNGKSIIVDAKTPLQDYLNAVESTDSDEQKEFMRNHAKHVKRHINSLSSKSYWSQFKGETPEFVVLFLPGETFFNAALEHEPDLIEEGVKSNVIIATPATLIALLHAIAYGWRQEKITENAKEIEKLGKEMYKRIADMGGHMNKLGNQLGLAVGAYNKTLGTMERRILPTARKFKELSGESSVEGGKSEDIITSPIDIVPREIESIEMKKKMDIAVNGDLEIER